MSEETSQHLVRDEELTAPPELEGKALDVPSADQEDELAPVPTLSLAERGTFIEEVHAYTRQFIIFGDQKAGFMFAVCSAMVAFMYGEGTFNFWTLPIGSWAMGEVIAVLSLALLLAGAFCSAGAVWPRLSGNMKGMVFWKAVASHNSADEYLVRLAAMEQGELAEAKARHLYEIASVCSAKYAWLTWSVWLGGAGIVLSLVLLASGHNL